MKLQIIYQQNIKIKDKEIFKVVSNLRFIQESFNSESPLAIYLFDNFYNLQLK